ncbi:MAG: hypothetical protein AB7I04_24455, partial [Pseudomonadales bacterium]
MSKSLHMAQSKSDSSKATAADADPADAKSAEAKAADAKNAKKQRDPEKDRALTAALAQIERQFGKGSMMRLGDREQVAIPSISTGSL